MPLLSNLADRLILCPSTDPIDPGDRKRFLIATANGQVEAWVLQNRDPRRSDGQDSETEAENRKQKLIVLKFPGAAGRAERSGVHPADVWRSIDAEVWTVNHLGYGGSDGPATIHSFPATATAVVEFLTNRYPRHPMLVVGNSLGCLSALFLAANFNIAGLFLRNPPPIPQMIRCRPRYSWWNFGLSRWVAAEIPLELDTIANAAKSKAPCLFVQSELDRMVPCRYQNMIISQYSGPKCVFQIEGGDHHDHVSDSSQADYFDALNWLRDQMNLSS